MTSLAALPSPPPFRLRASMNGIEEAPGKVWFFELAAAVIDAGRCIGCGACVAACPSDSIGVNDEGIPHLVKMCTGCSLCWDFCPRGGLRYEATWLRPDPGEDRSAPAAPQEPAPAAAPAALAARRTPPEEQPLDWRITGADPAPGLGLVRSRWAARVPEGSELRAEGAQDGGVVTAILVKALQSGRIDGAVLAREDPDIPWKGIPYLATTAEEILSCAGSFYNQTMALSALDLQAAGLDREARVALVGTPCEIQGIRALQARSWRRGSSRVDAVALSIALLCTKSFDYKKLMVCALAEERGVDLASVGKVDVIHGRMIVEDRSGGTLVDEPVKAFHGAALKGCDECADFLGRAADLSVGSVGSAAGWSSVLVRTGTGLEAFEAVRGELEVADLAHPEALEKLDRLDKKIAWRSLERPFDPEGPLFVDYEEHVAFYAGTERAPVWRGR